MLLHKVWLLNLCFYISGDWKWLWIWMRSKWKSNLRQKYIMHWLFTRISTLCCRKIVKYEHQRNLLWLKKVGKLYYTQTLKNDVVLVCKCSKNIKYLHVDSLRSENMINLILSILYCQEFFSANYVEYYLTYLWLNNLGIKLLVQIFFANSFKSKLFMKFVNKVLDEKSLIK